MIQFLTYLSYYFLLKEITKWTFNAEFHILICQWYFSVVPPLHQGPYSLSPVPVRITSPK